MGGDPWSEKTRKVLKDEIVTHDLTEEAGIDYINVLLVGEVGNIFFLFYNFNEETPIKIEIWISKCLVNDDILIINKCGARLVLGAKNFPFRRREEFIFQQCGVSVQTKSFQESKCRNCRGEFDHSG